MAVVDLYAYGYWVGLVLKTKTKITRPRPLLTRTRPKPELETKASSHEEQCIPAGSSHVSPPRRVFITMSIITMRSISRKFCKV